MYEESCSYRVNERKGELDLPPHCVECSRRKSPAFLWRKTNWILYWHYSMQCNSMQRELTIPLQGQCLCSLCLVWLSRENDLKLVHYLIQMWNSGMEPSKLWVWIHTLLFLCILTGIATTIHQIVMVSCNQSQRHPLSHAEPQKMVSWWHIHCWQWMCQNY